MVDLASVELLADTNLPAMGHSALVDPGARERERRLGLADHDREVVLLTVSVSTSVQQHVYLVSLVDRDALLLVFRDQCLPVRIRTPLGADRLH